MALINFSVTGADAIAAKLRELPGRVAKQKVVANALKAGAKVIGDQAKANLQAAGAVDTGLLANTMTIRRKAEQLPGLVEVALRPSSKLSMVVRKGDTKPTRARPSKYAHFVELGTEHSLAEPFMRPAVEGKAQEAVKTIRDQALAGIAAEARALGLKTTK